MNKPQPQARHAELEDNRQIRSLTSTRGIAAIMVFIHHFGTEVFSIQGFPSFFRMGNIAVGYFFVLSGFVLYVSYRDKQLQYGDYLKRRVARIVPVYFLALLLTVVLAVAYFQYNLHAARSIKEILLSAFFLQAFIPTYPLTLNLPGWTISVEMFFYLLFPLLLAWEREQPKYFLIGAIILFMASQYLHLIYFPGRSRLSDNIVDTIFFSPLIHLSQFLLGMIAGDIFRRIRHLRPHSLYFLPLLILVLIVLLIAYRPQYLSYQVGLIDPLFMALIITIAISDPVILRLRPLVYLGEISYGFYILQWPVGQFLQYQNETRFHITQPSFFYYALAITIAVSSITYFMIERPLKRKLRG